MSDTGAAVHAHSPADAKIALFRSLFRGREDIYARRFENKKTGRSGYAPACANEWVRGICEKPRIKCAECRHRRFLQVTDNVIRWHLSGRDDDGVPFVAGVYPMLLDETCFFLAVDFDKTTWADDSRAFLDTCRRYGLPASIERSRSGSGAHVWLFFQEAVAASLARKLGSHILTETMERRPEAGLDSYDRFFPSQDTLPTGGFGNLIALPLQRQARERGNSVFLDDDLIPHSDQWALLSRAQRIDRARAESIVGEAERRGRVVGVRLYPDTEDEHEPWKRPSALKTVMSRDLPNSLDLVVGNKIYVSKNELTPSLRNQLLRLAAFQNPEFYKAQSMRLPTYDKPRVIACAEDLPRHVALPRGCLDELLQLLSDLRIDSVIRDERFCGRPLNIAFRGTLRPEQRAAAEALLARDTGVLSATTAFGKTVIAAWLIAQRAVNTLVVVHRRQLLDQWTERLATFLDLPANAIGQIGGGRHRPKGSLDVALIQSLVRKGAVDERVGDYGHVIVDECHHLPAASFEHVARQARARFVTGLSATVTRKDGHHPIITMQCGPIRYRVNAKTQANARPFRHVVLVRPTSFLPATTNDSDARAEFQALYRGLVDDDARNRMICDDVVRAVNDGRSSLVLTERNDHLDRLANLLSPAVKHLLVLRGGLGKRQRQTVLENLAAVPEDEGRTLLATGKYIGEGFDDARLDTLMLTLPVSWRGTIAQYVGRLHRLHDAKREVRVYDYADLNVPMLARMFDRRCRGYDAVGYTISLPASAVPGWPADVALPSDPTWKGDYAASVGRLIRDGVDVPLGNLFLSATRPSDSAEGVDRARSASEAFLFRRLNSMEVTKGRFELNADLPIAFESCGQMEVDFLCADSRVVLEIDGAQHLSDEAAYRRDRRKDRLLQENGYFVLRFLAEDLGKELGAVLDTIIRVLASRERREFGRS